MRRILVLLFLCTVCCFCASTSFAGVFDDKLAKETFAEDVAWMISAGWKDWQNSVIVNGIEVEGARGTMKPGDMQGSFITAKGILRRFDKQGKAQEYIDSVKTVANSLENAMRAWQKGYSHDNIPFPQGASCSFTLPPCSNIPVTISSGRSLGRKSLTEKDLYGYMIYLMPSEDASVQKVMKASARAVSESFDSWEKTCSIVGIRASGGIAPHPAPMGTGPGPVRGAKGSGGKLVGPYISEDKIYDSMTASYGE